MLESPIIFTQFRKWEKLKWKRVFGFYLLVVIYDDFKRENLIDKSVENNFYWSHNAHWSSQEAIFTQCHPCCESSRGAFHKNRKTGKFNRKSPPKCLMHCPVCASLNSTININLLHYLCCFSSLSISLFSHRELLLLLLHNSFFFFLLHQHRNAYIHYLMNVWLFNSSLHSLLYFFEGHLVKKAIINNKIVSERKMEC